MGFCVEMKSDYNVSLFFFIMLVSFYESNTAAVLYTFNFHLFHLKSILRY